MTTVSNVVTQGSVLGPFCFILFINDLPLSVDVSTVLFADDAAFVVKSSSLTDLYLKINKLFADFTTYLNNNRLVANSSKSKLIIFSFYPTQNLPKYKACHWHIHKFAVHCSTSNTDETLLCFCFSPPD